MGETVKKGSRHFGIAKYAWPFAKGEVRRDDNRCSLVELRDEMEEQLPASLSEGEIAEFIEHDEVEPGQVRWSAIRPWRPARLSISRLLTGSTTLKKRPRAPLRMRARAMAMAK